MSCSYLSATPNIRVRLNIIRNELIKNVGKFQSCMISKLRIIFKRIVHHTQHAAQDVMHDAEDDDDDDACKDYLHFRRHVHDTAVGIQIGR